jgi:hypothetical protein
MMNSPPHGQLFKKISEDWGDLRFVLLAADLIRYLAYDFHPEVAGLFFHYLCLQFIEEHSST